MNGFVDSNGERIYYEMWGDGAETVILGHGMGDSHPFWYQQVAGLAERYRVVTWDQRGFGRSGASIGSPAGCGLSGWSTRLRALMRNPR